MEKQKSKKILKLLISAMITVPLINHYLKLIGNSINVKLGIGASIMIWIILVLIFLLLKFRRRIQITISNLNVENLFKRINRFGNEYNYCFGTFKPQSALPIALGAVGGLIEVAKQKNNISGYFVNKNENEICLIPVILDDHRVMQIDINGYIDIKPEEIKKIKIKNEDFIYKRITIILNDGTKYVMNSAKKVKGANYHQENLNKFIEIYK